MTVSAVHWRVPGAFLPATRSASATRCQPTASKTLRLVRPAASGGFHPDSVGASAPTDATAPASVAAPSSALQSHHPLLPYLISFLGHLHHQASSISQHLAGSDRAPYFHALGLGAGTRIGAPGHDSAPDSHHTDLSGDGSSSNNIVMAHFFSGYHVTRTSPASLPATAEQQQQQQLSSQLESSQQQQQQSEGDDGHLWVGPLVVSHLPWSPVGVSPGCETADSAAGVTHVPPPQPGDAVMIAGSSSSAGGGGGSESHHIVAAPSVAVPMLLWHSAMSLQQRALVTALWRMGKAAEAADKARRNMPPPAEVPGLVHWGAVAAAAHVEEAVVLALARTATAASAAAAGVPAATAAVTGSAAAAAAAVTVAAPHLPLLRHARRRLLAAAIPALEQLRGLQRGCTTHVLLRFLLYSSLNPRLRRDLHVRLDVLSHRAAQLALLQGQHDAWLARQLTGSAAGSAALASAAGRSPAAGAHPGALSARWYGRVFAPEMLSCARQLQLASPGSPPDDRTAGDPPGRFDLRDLYRLIRVIEVAVEDLERYD